MSEAQKDTIYIDVDDEITTIIDKVRSSDKKIVALVLPKRATVLQSVVNMKLLNRSATTAKKNLVLITSEAGLLPLAGAVGLHVAKNLQSKPSIPAGPSDDEIPDSLIHDEELDAEDEPELDDKKAIGELAGVGVAAAALTAEETIDMDDDEAAAGETKKAAKPKKDKKLKVPNFERFRKLLIIGGIALVVLIVGGYFAFVRLPKAKIVIKADSSDTNMVVSFTANTSTKTYDESSKVVPAQLASAKKTDSQTAPASGQKNNGEKATGNVTMTAQNCTGITPPADIPAGTGLSAAGQTYITQKTASFSVDNPPITNNCVNFKATAVTIVAQSGGVVYNTGTTSFTVAGRPEVKGSGSATGGTDNIVKVVSQADADAAKAKINSAAQSDVARKELADSIKKNGMMPIDSSFATEGPNFTVTPKVGDPGDNVTVASDATYSMLGVDRDSLHKLIVSQANKQIDTSKQAVLNDGLDTATYTVQGSKDNPTVEVTTTVTVGPNVNTEAIKKDIAGKKKAETIEIISSRPSIKSVTVNYSPFWVTKTPSNPNKVTITFEKANK